MRFSKPISSQDLLVEQLCVYFRFNPDKITYVERMEMIYIFHYMRQMTGLLAPEEIIQNILTIELPIKAKSKRKRLYFIYNWCQTQHMLQSKNYDFSTAKIPSAPLIDDYY